MLQDAYKIFASEANAIQNWNSIDKNELVNKFIEYEVSNPPMANAYMGAIICKYWPKIQRFYKTMSFSASYEDVYDLLINSILRAIKARRWLQEDSSIYMDPNGPDKAINRTMLSERLNFLLFKNRGKRVADLNPASINELEESSGDSYLYLNAEDEAVYSDMGDEVQIACNLSFLFNKKLYLSMFIYYCLSFNLDLFRDNLFNTKACAKVLLSLSSLEFDDIAGLVGSDKDTIEKCYNLSVSSKSRENLKIGIEFSILKLKELYINERI